MHDESVNDDVLTPTSLIGRLFASIADLVFVVMALILFSMLSEEIMPRRSMENNSRALFDLVFSLEKMKIKRIMPIPQK